MTEYTVISKKRKKTSKDNFVHLDELIRKITAKPSPLCLPRYIPQDTTAFTFRNCITSYFILSIYPFRFIKHNL